MRLDDNEKERFRLIMRKVAAFTGVEVLTYAVMTNHLHLLLRVPEKCEIAEEEVLRRIEGLYSRARAADVAMRLRDLREDECEEEAAELLRSYTYRMHDLSQYMKMVMQRFTMSYNKRFNLRGHLWEQRFKSILVEGRPDAISTMAAYIDLNAVRAGIVSDPKAYRFCGYGEAVAGNKAAKQGMKRIFDVLGNEGSWSAGARAYRKQLFMHAGAGRGSVIDREKIQEVLDAGGRLSKAQLLHCKVRYLSDGVVLGSKAFVEDIFQKHRGDFGLKRKTGARKPRYGEWGALCTMRDLRLKPVTLSAQH
jgi:REP element-mobilizing transposase RayT